MMNARNRRDNEEAASGILTLIFVFLLCGVMFVLMGYGIDRIVATSLSTFNNFPISQLRIDTVKFCITAFRFEPIIIMLGLGINHLINANRAQSGFSDLSTLSIAASEMIIITVVVIGLIYYGGAGIEMVVNIVNGWTVSSPDTSVFGAVQYTLPVFYGICFLALCGAIIQFLVQCVSVADYTQYYG